MLPTANPSLSPRFFFKNLLCIKYLKKIEQKPPHSKLANNIIPSLVCQGFFTFYFFLMLLINGEDYKSMGKDV